MDVAGFRLGRAGLGDCLVLGVGVVAQLLDALGLLLGLLLGLVKVDKVGRHLLDPQLLRLLGAQHVGLARAAGGGRFPQRGGRRDAADGRLGLAVFGLGEGGRRARNVLAVGVEEGRACAADDGGRGGARDGRGGLLDGGLVPRGEEVVVGLAGGGVGAVAGVGAIGDDDLVGVLLGVPSGPLLELLLVLGGGGRRVLGLGVLAVEGGRAAVLLKELGRRLVAADLHDAKLVPLPFCGGVLARARRLPSTAQGEGGSRTVEVGRAHKGNVDAEVAVVGRAVEAQVDAERDRRPCRVLLAAVEADLQDASGVSSRLEGAVEGKGEGGADLVGGLRLELLKDLERLLLGREAAHDDGIFGRFCLLVASEANSARAA